MPNRSQEELTEEDLVKAISELQSQVASATKHSIWESSEVEDDEEEEVEQVPALASTIEQVPALVIDGIDIAGSVEKLYSLVQQLVKRVEKLENSSKSKRMVRIGGE